MVMSSEGKGMQISVSRRFSNPKNEVLPSFQKSAFQGLVLKALDSIIAVYSVIDAAEEKFFGKGGGSIA